LACERMNSVVCLLLITMCTREGRKAELACERMNYVVCKCSSYVYKCYVCWSDMKAPWPLDDNTNEQRVTKTHDTNVGVEKDSEASLAGGEPQEMKPGMSAAAADDDDDDDDDDIDDIINAAHSKLGAGDVKKDDDDGDDDDDDSFSDLYPGCIDIKQ